MAVQEGRVKVTLMGQRTGGNRGDSPLQFVRADGEAPAVGREGHEIIVQVRQNRRLDVQVCPAKDPHDEKLSTIISVSRLQANIRENRNVHHTWTQV